MAQHWTSRVTRKARAILRAEPYPHGRHEIDADARRTRIELDAIRARFPDHA